MPEAEREHWPEKCGIPAADVRRTVVAQRRNISGTMFPNDIPGIRRCELVWDRDAGRLERLSVSFGKGGGPTQLTDQDIAPYLDLVLRELKPADQAAIAAIARGPLHPYTRIGPFDVRGGHQTDPPFWLLTVALP